MLKPNKRLIVINTRMTKKTISVYNSDKSRMETDLVQTSIPDQWKKRDIYVDFPAEELGLERVRMSFEDAMNVGVFGENDIVFFNAKIYYSPKNSTMEEFDKTVDDIGKRQLEERYKLEYEIIGDPVIDLRNFFLGQVGSDGMIGDWLMTVGDTTKKVRVINLPQDSISAGMRVSRISPTMADEIMKNLVGNGHVADRDEMVGETVKMYVLNGGGVYMGATGNNRSHYAEWDKTNSTRSIYVEMVDVAFALSNVTFARAEQPRVSVGD